MTSVVHDIIIEYSGGNRKRCEHLWWYQRNLGNYRWFLICNSSHHQLHSLETKQTDFPFVNNQQNKENLINPESTLKIDPTSLRLSKLVFLKFVKHVADIFISLLGLSLIQMRFNQKIHDTVAGFLK